MNDIVDIVLGATVLSSIVGCCCLGWFCCFVKDKDEDAYILA